MIIIGEMIQPSWHSTASEQKQWKPNCKSTSAAPAPPPPAPPPLAPPPRLPPPPSEWIHRHGGTDKTWNKHKHPSKKREWRQSVKTESFPLKTRRTRQKWRLKMVVLLSLLLFIFCFQVCFVSTITFSKTSSLIFIFTERKIIMKSKTIRQKWNDMADYYWWGRGRGRGRFRAKMKETIISGKMADQFFYVVLCF